ncbi:MAG TPA: UDP-N-acetylglucosamine 2-epimerase [Candidatus Saccharimonadales bacterium]|nr:UDP-N-acetylglucosamine 2-epimerase [Candidatus Saccharimonadales bacterium]
MIHFIVGTRAQLFKMAPIMLECEKRGLAWRWVYTAQHRDTIKETLDTFGLPDPAYTVVQWDTEAKTMGKIWKWFARMLLALPRSKKILGGYTGKKHIVLTHGDTLTTWIAALMGKLTRTKVMHVESGLRSFNMFKPFPEEINRLITFRLSDFYACPGDWAVANLKKYGGEKINTGENTQIDTITFGLDNAEKSDFKAPKGKYVVASIHRYENIFKAERFNEIVDRLEDVAKTFPIYLVQHPATFEQLVKLPDIKKRLERNKNIHLLPRLEYLPFVKLIMHSQFVITDGGGNQEELYHMGKPTLLFRNETERQEGLGTTTVISKLDPKLIDDFVKNYKKYEHSRTVRDEKKSPSVIIAEFLEDRGFGG